MRNSLDVRNRESGSRGQGNDLPPDSTTEDNILNGSGVPEEKKDNKSMLKRGRSLDHIHVMNYPNTIATTTPLSLSTTISLRSRLAVKLNEYIF